MLDERTVIGGHRVEGEIGRGGMGTVYRARHLDSGRAVALKVLADGPWSDPDLTARLRREGRMQAALEHPHVVTVYEAGESEHGLFIVMRLVDGPPLVALIRERELGVRRALDLLGQVAGALDAAHAAGLVHRDVKPHNVLVGPGDHAFLADFGLTHAADATAPSTAGAIAGTVAYLAPEVVQGQAASAASDRYAFAAMAFECLTGSVPFARATDAAVLFAHVNDAPPRAGARRAELGDDLDDLFARALAKDPAARPQSTREVVGAVRARLERSGALELPAPAPIGAHALGADTAVTPVAPPSAPVSPTALRRSRRVTVTVTVTAARVGIGAGVLVAAAFAGAALSGDPDVGSPAVASADRPGLQYLGADLDGPAGRALDCLGLPRRPASVPCTVLQSRLPGATLVVRRDGVIRRWSVRGAQGELTLAVLRPRDGGAFQLTLSDTEAVGSSDVQSFDTDLAVERGDVVGLRVLPGSAVGVRTGIPGASTERWLPPVGVGRPADLGSGSGFDHELLLRVGLLPGGQRRLPAQTTGSAARRLPAGRVRARKRIRLDGRPVDVILIEIAGRHALDLRAGDRRVARIDVPDLRSDAEIVKFEALSDSPATGGLDLRAVNDESGRVIKRFYALTARQFEAIN